MQTSASRTAGAGDILTVGFGTTAAMWAVGYIARPLGNLVPPALVVLVVLAGLILVAGGFVIGRYARRGLRGGAAAGLLAGVLNLLVVGSLISGNTPNAVKTGALLWVPFTLVVSAGLGAVGAAAGTSRRRPTERQPHWSGGLAIVAACATFLLLAVGGVVTGADEGLAVVDWPNTEGYNMFLYPLARMTGGIYLEHSHRLIGSLVGLTTFVLAIQLQAIEQRRWLKALGWGTLAAVIGQGILGGLRVTGHFTLSTRPADTTPSILLAVVHGVFAQVVFALLVAIAVFRARGWSAATASREAPAVSTDRALGVALVLLLMVQLVMGALVRHFTWAVQVLRHELTLPPARLVGFGHWALTVHITLAVIVALGAVAVGVRAWGIYFDVRILRRLGSSLLLLVALQIALGVAALIVTGDTGSYRPPRPIDVTITTLHQVIGAALLAWAVMLLLWNHRLLAGKPAHP